MPSNMSSFDALSFSSIFQISFVAKLIGISRNIFILEFNPSISQGQYENLNL